MDKIDDILEKIDLKNIDQHTTQTTNQAPEFSKSDESVIHRLFEMLQGIFPAFRSAWPTQELFDNAKVEWMKAFRQANLSDARTITRGINKFRLLATPFVPSPGQFITMCDSSPESLGLPSVEAAFIEACSNSHPCIKKKIWTHILVEQAWLASRSATFTSLPADKCRKIFTYHYLIIVRNYEEGKENLYKPLKAIEEIENTTLASKETAHKYLSKMFAELGVKRTYDNDYNDKV